MDNRPIGIFDSGLGGLTAVRVLRRLMPNENIIYFADTGRMPYGGRSRAQIRQIAVQKHRLCREKRRQGYPRRLRHDIQQRAGYSGSQQHKDRGRPHTGRKGACRNGS